MSDLRSAWRFFCDNAGYANPPGKAVNAMQLAKAEAEGKRLGLRFDWMADPHARADVDADVRAGHRGKDTLPEKVEACLAYGPDDDKLVLAGLSGIEDASDAYRRVVEAELAWEALDYLNVGELGTFNEGDLVSWEDNGHHYEGRVFKVEEGVLWVNCGPMIDGDTGNCMGEAIEFVSLDDHDVRLVEPA
jgi:hypothetical protein